MIADEEYILDIKQTEDDLDWHPQYNDEDMLKEAYQMYKKAIKNWTMRLKNKNVLFFYKADCVWCFIYDDTSLYFVWGEQLHHCS